MIQKFTVSRDDSIYQAWPDVALTKSGKLVCVFSECTHHGNRDYTKIVTVSSNDRGRTWTPKQAVTEGTKGLPYYYNCARITALKDGRLCIIVDKCPSGAEDKKAQFTENLLYFSKDEGKTWSKPVLTPLRGIVPDKLLELENGRWIIAAHHPEDGYLTQFMHYSDDQGKTWSDRITVGKKKGMNLCEVSILPIDDKKLVAFMRENSSQGWDCMKTISKNGGKSWGRVIKFPLPACHRPVAGYLQSGKIMITHRFMQGGKGWIGSWTQNLFAAITDKDSAIATQRKDSWARILPIDFDRSSKSDTGYSGWVQFPDGEIYIVNYIVDDALVKAQIRGYSLREEDFLIS